MEDVKIIELFWQRNERAVVEVSGKYTNYCYKIAWNVLADHEDCEECVNDTWFTAWKKIPPRRPAVLSSFLGRITRGCAIDRFRKKNAGKRIDSHIAELAEESGSILSYTLDEVIEEKELIRMLNEFLRRLSPFDRDVFIRRYWYMDSVREIARRHMCSESRIKSNLYRNRKKLKGFLERGGVHAG